MQTLATQARQNSFDDARDLSSILGEKAWLLSLQNGGTKWEPMALSLLNLQDKCEIDSEEITYPIAAIVFNDVEMALSVILVMADTINDERRSIVVAKTCRD